MQQNFIEHIGVTDSFGRCYSRWSLFCLNDLNQHIGNLVVLIGVILVFKSWRSVHFTFYNTRFYFFVAGQIDVVFLFGFLDGFFLNVAVTPFPFQFDVM